MSTVEPSARGTKRRSRDNAQFKMGLSVDLNSPPLEGTLLVGSSSSMHPPNSQGPAAQNVQQQGSSQLSSQGSNASPIDLEAIEDEVQMLSSFPVIPEALRRNRPRRNPPAMVVLDEEHEIRTSGNIEEPNTTLSLNTYCYPDGKSINNPVINCDLYPETEENNPKGKTLVTPGSVKEPPTFTCPICMNPLVEASSTVCGHIFCKECIKTAIKAQKKCPTCRKKLTKNNFHRVYLPSTD